MFNLYVKEQYLCLINIWLSAVLKCLYHKKKMDVVLSVIVLFWLLTLLLLYIWYFEYMYFTFIRQFPVICME